MLFRSQGMEQWKRADEVKELYFIFEDNNFNHNIGAETIPDLPDFTEFDNMDKKPMPKTWLVESILVTILPFIFCGSFLSLLGIVAIVYSAQVKSFYNRGDYTASLESSRTAGKWTKIIFWIFIAWILLIAVALFLLFGILGFNFNSMGDLIDM